MKKKLISENSDEVVSLLQDKREELETQNIQELNSWAKTFFIVLKSFIGTGILFMPKSFSDGGFLFSCIVLVIFGLMYHTLMLKLISVKESINVSSYEELGNYFLGRWCYIGIQIALVVSQTGFTASYMVFIGISLNSLIYRWFDLDIEVAHLVLLQAILFVPFSLVRKIKEFSITSFLGDLFILIAIGFIIGCDTFIISENGINPNITQFNLQKFPTFLGTAIFAYEGIGMILPIGNEMKQPKRFGSVLSVVMASLSIVFLLVGGLSYLTFGESVDQVVLKNLPESIWLDVVQVFYIIAIIFSVPLNAFPALALIE
jgi:proton-coupled amino acid transporter